MAELGLRSTPRLALADCLAPALGGAVFVAALLKGSAVIGDPDIQWHIAAGQWIVDHAAVPDRDPFSHSLPGAPWHAHEWLAELLFWAMYRAGGWPGVVLTAATAAGLGFGLLAAALQRYLRPRHVVMLSVAAFAVASQHLLARPHVLAWPLLVLWVGALCSAAERRTPPHPAWLLVMALWANLHGGYVLGLALAGLFAAEALWQSEPAARLGVLRGWRLFLLGAALASLLTPHHPAAGIEFALGFLDGGGFIAPIGEWRPADFRAVTGLELVLLGMFAMTLLGQLRLPPMRILMLVGLVHLALAHIRHGELLGLVGPLLVAAPLGARLCGSVVGEGAAFGRLRSAVMAGAVATLALGAALWAGRAQVKPPAAVTPELALTAARQADLAGEPVLNAFDFGGFLIAAGVPVFIDGRADFYGDDFLRRYIEAVSLARPGTLEALLDDHAIEWTMLQPGTPALLLLDRLHGWERLYSDAGAVVHRRLSAPH